MCFSLQVSLTSGVVIATIGIVTLKSVTHPSQVLFACIPLLFGFQQLTEGVVWGGLNHSSIWKHELILTTATYLFLFLARVVWPCLFPLSLFQLEKHNRRRTILAGFVVMGTTVAIYYTWCLCVFQVTPQISCHHIDYQTNFPQAPSYPIIAMYSLASISPLFISSLPHIKVLGIFMLVSYLVTLICFVQFLTSVWCFFAALISTFIWVIIRGNRGNYVPPHPLLSYTPLTPTSPTHCQLQVSKSLDYYHSVSDGIKKTPDIHTQ